MVRYRNTQNINTALSNSTPIPMGVFSSTHRAEIGASECIFGGEYVTAPILINKADATTLLGRTPTLEEYSIIFFKRGTPLVRLTEAEHGVTGMGTAFVFTTEALTTPYTMLGAYHYSDIGSLGQTSSYTFPEDIGDYIAFSSKRDIILTKNVRFHVNVGQSGTDASKYGYTIDSNGNKVPLANDTLINNSLNVLNYQSQRGVASYSTDLSVIPTLGQAIKWGLAGKSASTPGHIRWYIEGQAMPSVIPAGRGVATIQSTGLSSYNNIQGQIDPQASLVAQFTKRTEI